jgi:cytochrome c554/c'-like protein
LQHRGTALILLTMLVACDKGAASGEGAGGRSSTAVNRVLKPVLIPASSALPAPEKADRTHRAERCGECHEKMYQEWHDSPHAHTNDTAAYQAQRAATGDPSCERCHEPLRQLGTSLEFARKEDVSCEVCHRMGSVEVHTGFAEAPLLTAHRTKYGPRCDPSRPYFHLAECKPVFKQSELCAACHLLSITRSDGVVIPVHTEYSDWLKGPYPARGKTCQSCHMMPGVRAELAIGESERNDVPDHGFWGKAATLHGTGISAKAVTRWRGDRLLVNVTLTNARAGHWLPAGAPGRQLVLRVSLLDASGRELSREERAFERRLVDDQGQAAPFNLARAVGADTRLAPLESRVERFDLQAGAATAAKLALLRRSDPELARRLGVTEPPEDPIASVSAQLASNTGAHLDSRPLVLAP